jgi:hypothetical protein
MNTPTPMTPRITKSTAVAAIRARFETDGDLLERFEVAKEQANLWDGERDGLREAVKIIQPGQYTSTANNNVVLSRTETAKVCYPNSSGKHQLESTLQTSIQIYDGLEPGADVIALQLDGVKTAEQLVDLVLHHVQRGKQEAIDYLQALIIGSGVVVDNADLYEKKGSEKSSIVVLPLDI